MWEGKAMPSAQNRSVSADYFAVMGIPFLSGYGFGKGTEQNPPKEIVISESLAHRVARRMMRTKLTRRNGP
jgi:hypothetical protein